MEYNPYQLNIIFKTEYKALIKRGGGRGPMIPSNQYVSLAYMVLNPTAQAER